MLKYLVIVGLGLMLLVSWPTASDRTVAQRAPPKQPGLPTLDSRSEVPDRPVVHEAVASPPRPAPIVPTSPPGAIEESPHGQRPQGINMQFLGGYWAWNADSNLFQWISGLWRDLPPGRQWVPGYWEHQGDGWQRVPGYWAEHAKIDSLSSPADTTKALAASW